MSEEIQVQEDPVQEEVVVEESVDDLKKQIEKMKLEREQAIKEKEIAKKSQSGSDKAVAELKARLDALEKEKMSDEEKVKYAEQKAEEVRIEYEKKIRDIELEKFVSQKIADNKIDSRFSPLLAGKDEVEITEKENLLKELLNDIREQITNDFRSKGAKPSGGIQTQINGEDLSALTPQKEVEMYKKILGEKGKAAADQFLKDVSAAKKIKRG